MGLFEKVFGGKKPAPKPSMKEAGDLHLESSGISRRAAAAGSRPVCPECGFVYPRSEKEAAEQGGSAHVQWYRGAGRVIQQAIEQGVTPTCLECETKMIWRDEGP